jgi:uncharacterized protein
VKYLLVLLVVVVGAWMLLRRRERPPPAAPVTPPKSPPADGPAASPAPQAILACAHCGVHLPKTEVQFDALGRPFCSEAHRLQGPRAGA